MTKLPTTKLQRLIRRPAPERGFTLIELLVVIIILGILAAVVVFAVSGVGDKGKSSAVSIDERTLRTAEEAYCAKFGKYGDGDDLVAVGSLSGLPKYHNVYARQDGGSCNGWSFDIIKSPSADPDSGKWTATTASPTARNSWTLLRLPNGKVLHLIADFTDSTIKTAEWDWATAQWTMKDSVAADQTVIFRNTALVLTDDLATSSNDCGSNCGKVLMRVADCGEPADPTCQPWRLFNPGAAATQQWEQLTSLTDVRSASNLNPLVQLRDDPATPGTQCGDNCGKVLITSPNTGQPELYDPKLSGAAAFSSFSFDDPLTANLGNNTLLPDGRVILFGQFPSQIKAARLLDPATLQWSVGAAPTYEHSAAVRPPLLPNGELFAPPSTVGQAEIYTPVPGGSGSWRQIASGSGCPTAGVAPFCHIFDSLPDGRVLAYSSNNATRGSRTSHTGKTWIFDPSPGQDRWVGTANLLHPWSMDGILLDPRTGPCGAFCNKVLVVGANTQANTTALYTP